MHNFLCQKRSDPSLDLHPERSCRIRLGPGPKYRIQLDTEPDTQHRHEAYWATTIKLKYFCYPSVKIVKIGMANLRNIELYEGLNLSDYQISYLLKDKYALK